jgi:flagellar hook assembly protein FlgD
LTGVVRLDVYNSRGQHVRTLVDGERDAGIHRVTWDGTDGRGIEVAAGVYFCELRWKSEKRARRMVLLK